LKIKNILVSQPEPTELDKSPYGDLSKRFKLQIDFRKFITVEGLTASEFRKHKVYILDHTAIIFTSRNAVDNFFRIAKEMRVDIPDNMKYFCISEAVAFYLQKYVQFRKRKIFHGRQTFEDLLEIIVKHNNENYLLPCSDIQKTSIPRMLDAKKVKYTKAVIYKTVASNLADIDIQKYDMIVFFSPAGVKSLFTNFPDFQQNSTLIGAFGPTTAKAIKEAGLKLNVSAPTKTALSMTMAIEEFLVKQAENKK